MNTSQTGAQKDIVGDLDFLKYPIHKVVSVFPDHDKVDAAVSELRSAGFLLMTSRLFAVLKKRRKSISKAQVTAFGRIWSDHSNM